MIHAYSAQQVRDGEAPQLAAGVPLMQHAAYALAHHTLRILREQRGDTVGGRVLLLVGGGNNGGDALHAGALLRRHGIVVETLPLADSLHAEGERVLRTAGGRIRARDGALPENPPDLVLDAVLGTGGRPPLRPEARELFDRVRAAGIPVIAVDLPSGLDATTGEVPDGILHASHTITFGAHKAGLLLPGGAEAAGQIHEVDIGLGPDLPEPSALRRLESSDAAALWPEPSREDHKYSRGVVQLDAGSPRFPGAAILAASGAARAGAGMVRVHAEPPVIDHVLHHRPEIVSGEGKHGARVVGPGCEEGDARFASALAELAEPGVPGVIDAGALSALGPEHRFHPEVVLTPHAGEAARLAAALGVDQVAAPVLAQELADHLGATVLLKGAITLIAAPRSSRTEGTCTLTSQDDATSQLATAGAGDVLAGVIGTLLAAGLHGPDAAAVAALVHGRAARLASAEGRVPILALDVADALPAAVATILSEAGHTGTGYTGGA